MSATTTNKHATGATQPADPTRIDPVPVIEINSGRVITPAYMRKLSMRVWTASNPDAREDHIYFWTSSELTSKGVPDQRKSGTRVWPRLASYPYRAIGWAIYDAEQEEKAKLIRERIAALQTQLADTNIELVKAFNGNLQA